MEKSTAIKFWESFAPAYCGKDRSLADIEKEIHVDNIMESVKSNRAAFTDEELGHDYDTIWNNYFQQDKAQRYSYITWDNENVIAYVMNIEEFKEFAKAFTFFEKGTVKRHDRIRFKKESKKMLKWLNARAE